MKVFLSSSSKKTKKFAEALARRIANRKSLIANGKSAPIVALEGELGSGKTTFVQGFLRGLGIKKHARSPTFIIFRRFALRDSRFANVYHVDAYRIKNPRELLALGIKEIFSDPRNIVLIEWADKIRRILPRRRSILRSRATAEDGQGSGGQARGTICVRFSHGKRENERLLRMQR